MRAATTRCLCAAGALLIAVFLPASRAGAQEDPFARVRAAQDPSPAEVDSVPSPPSGAETVTRNLSVDLEMLGRTSFDETGSVSTYAVGAGAELYTRIVTGRGTWGAADLQLRSFRKQPEREMTFETHNAYLEKRLLFGRLNLRAGHFQVPFNLEALPIDTHTPIIQLSNQRALGLKHDWGVGASGQLEHVDYDVAYTIGSGMDFALEGAGLGTGRVGWQAGDGGLGFGLSGAAGERAMMARKGDGPVPGWRMGADASYHFGPANLLAEASGGADEGRAAWAALGRLEAETPGRRLAGAAQYTLLRNEGTDTIHRGELEAAVRLLFITRKSFIRLNGAVEDNDKGPQWLVTGQLYLLFGG